MAGQQVVDHRPMVRVGRRSSVEDPGVVAALVPRALGREAHRLVGQAVADSPDARLHPLEILAHLEITRHQQAAPVVPVPVARHQVTRFRRVRSCLLGRLRSFLRVSSRLPGSIRLPDSLRQDLGRTLQLAVRDRTDRLDPMDPMDRLDQMDRQDQMGLGTRLRQRLCRSPESWFSSVAAPLRRYCESSAAKARAISISS